jgi:hypothetical protein
VAFASLSQTPIRSRHFAKQKALEEGKTLTELIVDGLRIRLSRTIPARTLPISTATGGLLPGVDWERLEVEEPAMDIYR